jgi:hypothetical protein
MSERSLLHTPEETISRFLNGKINDPHVSTLIDTGATVDLAPYEIFMDSVTAAEFRLFLESREKNIDNSAQLEVLKIKTAELEAENLLLKTKLEHKEELLQSKEELIRAYRKLVD